MRNRSSAIAITTNTKRRISSEIGLDSFLNDKDKLEKFANLMEKELNSNNQFKTKTSTSNDNTIDIPPPNYLDIKKEYLSRYDKVINIFCFYNLNYLKILIADSVPR